MADIYLTKKERTTLYTEGLIYSIIIVLASYLTIYGGIFIKMIPMLFILGIIGRCIFDKPKTTLALGTIAILLIGFMTQFKIDFNLILTTIYSTLLIAIGLRVGQLIRSLYYSYKLRVFIGYNKKAWMIIYLVFLIVLAVFLNSIVNSNPIQYMIAKDKTDKYVKEIYGQDKYKVESIEYNLNNRGGYVFTIIVSGKEAVLVHRTLNNIEDISLEKRKDEISKIGNEKLGIWKVKNNIEKGIILDAIYSYSKVALEPDNIEINLEAGGNEEDAILSVIDSLNKLKTFDEYSKITSVKLTINNKSMSIKKEKMLEGLTKEYIQKGLEIEYLD